jgi:hypothetical protein
MAGLISSGDRCGGQPTARPEGSMSAKANKRREREQAVKPGQTSLEGLVDEKIMESFPASDPVLATSRIREKLASSGLSHAALR